VSATNKEDGAVNKGISGDVARPGGENGLGEPAPGAGPEPITDRSAAEPSIASRGLGQSAKTQTIRSDLAQNDLTSKIRLGLGWKLASSVFGQGTQSLVAILLAHLLVPREFGLAGMAIAFSGLALAFSDLGLGSALVQKSVLTEEDRSTVFWVNVASGAALTILGAAASPLIARFFSSPDVTPLFAVLSTSFLLIALGQTQAALLTREMSFRSLELRTIVATIVGAVAALLLAVAGFGAWAIIGQLVCTSGASTVMLWTVSSWRPRLVFSRESFVSLGSFGVKTFLMRVLVYVNLNGDNLLVGRYLGTTALGVYAVAYNLMMLPTTRITERVRDVFYAAFARLQNDPRRLGEAWLRVNGLTGALLVPAFLGLFALAPDVVPVVLGRRWHEAVPVLQLLSLGGVASCLQAYNGNVYQALGRPGRFLRFMCFSTAVTFSAFVIGLQWGIVGVAGSFAAARWIVLMVNTLGMSRLTSLNPLRPFGSYVAVLVRAGVMAVVVALGRLALLDSHVAAAPRLVLLIAAGITVYALVTLVAAPQIVRDIRTGLARRRVPATT
jgi:O-antigen/teichoic acid export membrane protein